MPAYNAEKYIAQAIASILAQAHRPIEIIVVNDGSTDATAERAAAFGDAVTLLTQEHQGINRATNFGIEQAHGDWLAWLDADDLWMPRHLELEFAAFAADPTLTCVYGHVQNFYSPDTDAEYRTRVTCPPEPMQGLVQSTLLIRRADFLRIGLFPTVGLLGGFMDWFARASDAGYKYILLPHVLSLRRLHPGNSGIREQAQQSDYVRVLKQVLERRRAARST